MENMPEKAKADDSFQNTELSDDLDLSDLAIALKEEGSESDFHIESFVEEESEENGEGKELFREDRSVLDDGLARDDDDFIELDDILSDSSLTSPFSLNKTNQTNQLDKIDQIDDSDKQSNKGDSGFGFENESALDLLEVTDLIEEDGKEFGSELLKEEENAEMLELASDFLDQIDDDKNFDTELSFELSEDSLEEEDVLDLEFTADLMDEEDILDLGSEDLLSEGDLLDSDEDILDLSSEDFLDDRKEDSLSLEEDALDLASDFLSEVEEENLLDEDILDLSSEDFLDDTKEDSLSLEEDALDLASDFLSEVAEESPLAEEEGIFDLSEESFIPDTGFVPFVEETSPKSSDTADLFTMQDLETALERVITRLFADKLDAALSSVVERVIEKEIALLKKNLYEE